MDKNKIIISVVSVLAIVAFMFFAYKFTNTETRTNYPAVNVIQKNDHLHWSKEKKNILVEYADLQCPACQNFYMLIKSNIETTDIPKKITYVYRQYPLTNVHIHAQEAAQAAEAAGMQDKFFEYVDVLYKTQQQWESLSDAGSYFDNVAKDLKLDLKKFQTDKNSQTVKDRIAADVASGNSADVNATPTFYLNGQKLDSIRTFDDFKNALAAVK